MKESTSVRDPNDQSRIVQMSDNPFDQVGHNAVASRIESTAIYEAYPLGQVGWRWSMNEAKSRRLIELLERSYTEAR